MERITRAAKDKVRSIMHTFYSVEALKEHLVDRRDASVAGI
jgi:hypothetical protein